MQEVAQLPPPHRVVLLDVGGEVLLSALYWTTYPEAIRRQAKTLAGHNLDPASGGWPASRATNDACHVDTVRRHWVDRSV
ncbi:MULTISPECIES: hypothetical protein [Amycolatopsis]|uniref:Uncharacterized protein n=1 Tax=Amycolatopsis bullii TaxID=941987 RepID=A0ABQ3KPB6_9PSEU|nr:hypothetical protein [Amycolatopsis bullii]GHG41566.1 hypothetical protein GCM10017567_73860 [Amycolatopsis bullii]